MTSQLPPFDLFVLHIFALHVRCQACRDCVIANGQDCLQSVFNLFAPTVLYMVDVFADICLVDQNWEIA